MIAYKLYEDCPEAQRPKGIPLVVPWQLSTITEEQISYYQSKGFIVSTEEEYNTYLLSINSELEAWQAISVQLEALATVDRAIRDAMDFGAIIIREFSSENVLLGITQLGKTGEVLDKLQSVLVAVQAGSLYEAINRIKAVPVEDYDLVFITEARLLGFCNKIETYLGLPLSTSL